VHVQLLGRGVREPDGQECHQGEAKRDDIARDYLARKLYRRRLGVEMFIATEDLRPGPGQKTPGGALLRVACRGVPVIPPRRAEIMSLLTLLNRLLYRKVCAFEHGGDQLEW